jgi:tetratricopeptide (TPR) repeat protein
MQEGASEQGPGSTWLLPREGWVLVGFAVSAILLFVVTSSIVSAHKAEQEALGRDWYRRGEKALETGQPDAALQALRNALVYDRENPRYHFRLAQALVASGRVGEARAYLLGLRESEPGNGPVNLELARLATKAADTIAAATYYRAAIQGEWDAKPVERRLETRLELAALLVDARSYPEALSELILLTPRLPREPAVRTRLADLLGRAGDRPRAIAEYRTVLRLDPGYAPALLGAGRTAFEARDWPRAVFYLRRARQAKALDPTTTDLLTAAEAVVAADPSLSRLTVAERARRAAQALRQAAERLAACGAGSPSEALTTFDARLAAHRRDWAQTALRRNPDRIEPAMELVYAVERETAARCGAPVGPDRALLLLAGEAEGGES